MRVIRASSPSVLERFFLCVRIPVSSSSSLGKERETSFLAVEVRNPIPVSSHPRIVSSRGLRGKGVSKLVRGHGTLMLEQKEVRC